MIYTIREFMKRPFVKNVFILASGTAIAQAINMLFSPLITRVYGPESYGLMGTFAALVQILAPISALSYPIASVLPKYDEEAKVVVKISFYITLINTFLVFILLLLFHNTIVDIFNLESISNFLYFIPFVVLSAGMMQIIQQWMIRKRQFQIPAKANLLETIFVNAGKLIVGIFYPFASILIFFTTFRQGVRAVSMYFFYRKIDFKTLLSLSKHTINQMFRSAIKYKDFLLYRTPEVFLSAISVNIPILLLTTFFGAASVGFYSISKTVLGVPATLIAKSVGDVFYPQVSKAANNKQNITPLVIKSTFYLALVGAIPYGIVILFGPNLFSIVFGEAWTISGEYARWISIWSFFNFINRPSVQTLPVISAQKFQLIFSLCKLLITGVALFMGYYFFNNDIIAIALYSIFGALSYSVLILLTISKSKRYDNYNI